MANEEWDVLRDLHFLFANDEKLHDQLVYMCDLLSNSGGDESPGRNDEEETTNESKPKAQSDKKKRRSRAKIPHENTSYARQKREIDELRLQVDLLREDLQEARRNAVKDNISSEWEQIAREQFFEQNKAIQENEKLRTAVHQHATFIDDMTKILNKKPRLTPVNDSSSDAWQLYKLAAHASLRSAAIHAIADRQYSRMKSKFVQVGLYKCTEDILRANWTPQPDGNVLVEYAYHVSLAAPLHLIGEAVWKVFSSDGMYMDLPPDSVETLETLDKFTLYRTFQRVRTEDGLTVHSNIVYKRFIENQRQVLVWRSVLEDELLPHMSRGSVHDETGWIQLTPISQSSCRITLLLHVIADPVHDFKPSSVDEHLESSRVILENFSFLQQPDEPGMFPGAPIKSNLRPNEMSFAKQTFVPRAKKMELSLHQAIKQVVQDYKEGQFSSNEQQITSLTA
ncbi:unnamed protein product [Aphanomyces euteiches]|uniref:START domain-containing protein n=1 Tax=Aphanomyces euteiches TaxID=100861 RepID=A0A6G0X7H3_9STRA|nr:hypothetical protein Ae201684_007703 [Aphanomyces euteiches]KAH9143994.1 hypothetical protein AeRB84_012034 [Aphanomyces euteiches]